jgi:hypothetical protein
LALTVKTMAAMALGCGALLGCAPVPVSPRPAAPPATSVAAPAHPSAATTPPATAAAASAPVAPPRTRPAPRPPTPASIPKSAAAAAPARAAAPPVAARPAAPALDLASLEQRLKDTKAIGVFTKLSLKNQVDDLLAQLRDFYARKSTLTLGQLRQKYDLLLLKVLSVLQDGDPALASAISASREAIWGILADPQKFSKL